MTALDREIRAKKADRALELREQGLLPETIAERLGVNPHSVYGMIVSAKKRREQTAGEGEV